MKCSKPKILSCDICVVICILLLQCFIPVIETRIEDADKNSFDFSDTKMLENMNFENEVEDIEKRCDKISGRGTYEKVKVATEDLVSCLEEIVNMTEIQEEAEEASHKGELDEVFKKYCGRSPKVRSCIQNFLSIARLCLHPEEHNTLNITMDALDAALDFICYKEGDRIAIFMGEDGKECWDDRGDAISNCINGSFPQRHDLNINWIEESFVFNDTLCEHAQKIEICVVSEMSECKDPTPANFAESLFKAVKMATPCWTFAESSVSSASHCGIMQITILFSILFSTYR